MPMSTSPGCLPPRRRLHRPAGGPAAVLPGLLLLLALGACSDDAPTNCPTFQVGAVEGVVRVAGRGASLTVGARGLEGPAEGYLVAATVADADGRYRLDLPAGRYRLELEPSSGGTFSGDERDVVTVTPTVLRHDFDRGRVEMALLVPDRLEGLWFTLSAHARNFDHASARARVTDGTLDFVIPLLREGRYGLSLSPESGYPDADSLWVGTGAVTTRTKDFRSTAASISGQVTGSWQPAGAGAPRLEGIDAHQRSCSSATCDAEGAFTLTLLDPRDVRLRVSIGSVRQWLGGADFATARTFAPAPGAALTGADLVESGLDLHLDGPGDLIVARAALLIRDEAGSDLVLDPVYGARHVVCNLAPGRYYVRVDGLCDGQPWARQWYDGAETAAAATPVDLATGELRRLDFALVTGGRIAGQVLTAAGADPGPLNGQLRDDDGLPLCSFGSSYLANGRFDYRGLPDGDYRLVVAAPGGGPWWYPGTTDFAASTAITIAGHAEVTGLTWRLPGEPGEARP